MRIGIDARLGNRQGVGRHIAELIVGISALDTKNEYIVYSKPGIPAPFLEGLKDLKNIQWRVIGGVPFRIREQILLVKAIRHDRLDSFHCTFDYGMPLYTDCKTLLTVHDAWLESKTFFSSEATRCYYQFMTRQGLKKARRVIAVSDFIRQKILTLCPWIKREGAKIKVIHNGVGKEFYPLKVRPTPLLEKFGIQNYILYLGVLAKNKNIFGLLEAYAQLTRKYPNIPRLVIGGKQHQGIPDPIAFAEKLGLKKSVLFLGFVPEEELPNLYRGAELFLLSSLHEGFGIPVLEAMACGTPVVASNKSAIPEVAGNAAVLIDPTRPEAIQEGVTKVLFDLNLRKDLIKRGIERAKTFSWEKMALSVLEIYREIYEEN